MRAIYGIRCSFILYLFRACSDQRFATGHVVVCNVGKVIDYMACDSGWA